MALKIDSKFEEKLTIAFKMKWRILQIFVHRLKNSDFISESQMVKLNQNGNSKLQDRPDAVWNFILNEWINEWMIQLAKLFTQVAESLFLKYKKISR